MFPARIQCLKPTVAARQLQVCARAAFGTEAGRLSDIASESPESHNTAIHRARYPTRSHSRDRSHGSENPISRIVSLVDKSPRGNRRHRDLRASHHTPKNTAEELEKHKNATALTKQITRRWKTGDIYAPHDLSEVEMKKWKRRGKPTVDVFDVLELDPMVEYRNFSMLSEYMTPMGRIMHSKDTGLRSVNQRKIARAIRRGIGMGFMPSVHRHPEILMKESTRRNEPLSRITKF